MKTESFRSGYSQNVIAELPGSGDPSKIVLMGAHYDSRSTSLSVASVGSVSVTCSFTWHILGGSEPWAARSRCRRQRLGYLRCAGARPCVCAERPQVRSTADNCNNQ